MKNKTKLLGAPLIRGPLGLCLPCLPYRYATVKGYRSAKLQNLNKSNDKL